MLFEAVVNDLLLPVANLLTVNRENTLRSRAVQAAQGRLVVVVVADGTNLLTRACVTRQRF